MHDKALRGVPWTLLSYVGSKLVSVITMLVLARMVTPRDFGVLAVAALASNFLTWFADMGFSGTLVVRQDLDARGMGTLLTLMGLTGLLAGVVAVALAPLAALAFHTPRVTGVLAVIAILLPLGSLVGFWEALMQREFAFRRRFVAMMSQPLAVAAVSIPLAAAGRGVWALVIGQVAGMAVVLVVLWALKPFPVRPSFDRELARSAFSTSRGFLGQGVAMYVRQNVDTVTVGAAFGSRSLGFYSMANRLGDLVYWTIAHPVGKVTFPSFAKSRHEGDEIRPSFLRVLRMVALVSCPVGVLMSASAGPFTRVVFGDRWLPMVGPLAIMGLWAAVRQMDQTLLWLLNAINRAGSVAWISVGILVPLIAGCLAASSIGGLTAVALVPLGDTVLSALLGSALVRRYLGITFSTQLRTVAPAVLAAIPTWLLTWWLGHALHPDRHALVALLVSLAGGALTYAILVWLLAPRAVAQGFALVERMLGRAPAEPIPTV